MALLLTIAKNRGIFAYYNGERPNMVLGGITPMRRFDVLHLVVECTKVIAV